MRCNLCESDRLSVLIAFGAHPIAHHFLADAREPAYAHPVTLCFCERCGLVQLTDPVPPEMFYTEYVCLSSWKHQPHLPRFAELIAQLPRLEPDAHVLEVGSNDGRFLEALRQRGFSNARGIEPARDACAAAERRGVETIPGYFTEETVRQVTDRHGRCDVLVARQVLEHVSDLRQFRQTVDSVLAPGGYLAIEVPNFACKLMTSDYTIWEEHVNYFTPETLGRWLADAGVRVLHSETALFSGETLIVLGERAEPADLAAPDGYMTPLRDQVYDYRDRWPDFREAVREYIQSVSSRQGEVVLYGAGAHACSFVNFTDIGPFLTCVLDDQWEKQGRWFPGSRLPIVPGSALEEQRGIALCLLGVNTENEDAVIAKHPTFAARGGVFASILPPSNRLLPVWGARAPGARVMGSCAPGA